MAVNCSARLNHLGRRMGVVLTGRPIGELRRAYEALHTAHTELQRAQRKLVEQEKMASLGRLVAGVAHELNNPISFVYGNVHTLDRYRQALAAYLAAVHGSTGHGSGGVDLGGLRRDLKIDKLMADLPPLIDGTLEGVARVAEIVRNLRHLSFSKTGDAQNFDVEKVIRTASQWASRAKKFSAEMVLDLEPGVMVTGNEGQIHQVMVNLIDNALDAVQAVPEPKVVITLSAHDAETVITVADNGPGVSMEVRDKIFEPFFTTKEVGEGTGLGLWISYTIVQEHSGSITLGASPGGGAQFTVTLPRG
jgi:two-component system sensor histidine kinase HupT/HoxJ